MSWIEAASSTFVARFDARDEPDVVQVLAQLEQARARFAELLPATGLGELAIVLHGTEAQLDAAQPWLVVQRAQCAPAGRRYVVGWCGDRELHVLSPRVLAHRASNAPGSIEHLMLAPVALLAKRMVCALHAELPPPYAPRTLRSARRWAWLVEGAAQWLSGQAPHTQPLVARRLRETRRPPSLPVASRDAPVLAGSVLELLEREEGRPAVLRMVSERLAASPEHALVRAFGNRPLRHTEDAWRAYLQRLAEGTSGTDVRRRRAERPATGVELDLS